MTQNSHLLRYDPEHIFFNPDPYVYDRFGTAVALEGNKAAILAPRHEGYGRLSQVYFFDTNTGKLLNILTLDDNIPPDSNIVLNGDRLLVVNKNPSTECVLFEASTGKRLQTFSVPYHDPRSSLAMYGEYVVIVGNANSKSTIYVFNANTGELQNTIPNPYPHPTSPGKTRNFVSPLALEGEKILTASSNNSGNMEGLLFNTTGEILQTFVKPSEDTRSEFGNGALAMQGDFVLFSNSVEEMVPNVGNTTPYGSKVYLYSAKTGKLLRTFSSPLPSGGYNFGSSIAIDGNSLLIGDSGINVAGEVYHFDVITGDIIEAFTSPFPLSGKGFYDTDRFGAPKSIAIAGNSALIGAFQRNNDDQTPNQIIDIGQAYLYSLGSGGTGGGTESGKSYQIQSTSGFVLTVSGQTNTVFADVQGSSNVDANGQKWTITDDGMIKSYLGNFALDLVPLPQDPDNTQQKAIGITAIDPNSPTQKWEITADGQLKNKSNGFVAVLMEYNQYPGNYFVDAFAPEKLSEFPYWISYNIIKLYEYTWQFIEI